MSKPKSTYIPPNRRTAIEAAAQKEMTTEKLQDMELFPSLGSGPAAAPVPKAQAQKQTFKEMMEERIRQEKDAAEKGEVDLLDNLEAMTIQQLEAAGYACLNLTTGPRAAAARLPSNMLTQADGPPFWSSIPDYSAAHPLFEAYDSYKKATRYRATLARMEQEPW